MKVANGVVKLHMPYQIQEIHGKTSDNNACIQLEITSCFRICGGARQNPFHKLERSKRCHVKNGDPRNYHIHREWRSKHFHIDIVTATERLLYTNEFTVILIGRKCISSKSGNNSALAYTIDKRISQFRSFKRIPIWWTCISLGMHACLYW